MKRDVAKRRSEVESRVGAGLDLSVSLFVALGIILSTTLCLVFVARDAYAIPSFGRQTGQPCAACHTQFPELTPFGRRFKLRGYTAGGGGVPFEELPPLSVALLPTFTKTAVRQDARPTSDTHTNDNLVLQDARLFYGGTVYENLGAFIHATYDKASKRVFLDDVDLRYAKTTNLFGVDALYGLNVNNSPTIQDVWNTTPSWGYPFVSSTLAPQFEPPATQVDGAFAGRSVGTGAYVFLNDAIYAEVSAYHNLSKGELRAIGQPCANNSDFVAAANGIAQAVLPPPALLNFFGPCSSSSLNSAAPYWRVAFEPTRGPHSLMVGAFGFYPEVLPGRIVGYGVDRYRDIGFDAQYQYINDPHSITLRVSRIRERQQLNSSFAQGIVNALEVLPFDTGNGASNRTNTLTSFKASASYVWNHTVGGTIGYFNVYGTNDSLLYGNAFTNPGNSAIGSPNGRGLTFELAYTPLSKGGPSFYPWADAKVGVLYTRYLELFGGTTAFDGQLAFNGSVWRAHNASDNNTLFLYTWISF